MNSRGVTSRDPFEGGTQERALAQALREVASKVNTWPRARALLTSMAESWQKWAEMEDTEAQQLRLRE
jgi:protein-disulfide isomerase